MYERHHGGVQAVLTLTAVQRYILRKPRMGGLPKGHLGTLIYGP